MSIRRTAGALALLVLLATSRPSLLAADAPPACDCPCCEEEEKEEEEAEEAEERDAPQPKRQRRASGLRTWETGRRFSVQPALFSCEDFQRALAVNVSWIRKMGFQDAAVTLTASRPEAEEPDDEFQVTILRLRYERRHYVRNRLFLSLGGGVQHVNPGSELRHWAATSGHSLGAELRPFASVGLGWQIHRMRMGRRWFPLVARLGHEAARPFRLPAPLPGGGVTELDTSGLSLSLAVNFRW